LEIGGNTVGNNQVSFISRLHFLGCLKILDPEVRGVLPKTLLYGLDCLVAGDAGAGEADGGDLGGVA